MPEVSRPLISPRVPSLTASLPIRVRFASSLDFSAKVFPRTDKEQFGLDPHLHHEGIAAGALPAPVGLQNGMLDKSAQSSGDVRSCTIRHAPRTRNDGAVIYATAHCQTKRGSIGRQ